MTRIALITVDNYPGIQGAQLAGCVNDGLHMQAALEAAGFDDIRMLVDAQDTRANIETELTRLVADLGPDDLGVWHRSSHGTQGAVAGMPHEPDRLQEGIVPYDFREKGGGILWAHQIQAILQGVHRWARFVWLADLCFAGGNDRNATLIGEHYRAYRYLPPSEWLRDVDVEAAVELAADEGYEFYDEDDARGFVLASIDNAARGPRPAKAYPVVLAAACREDQVAYCADIPGPTGQSVPQGAFTWALLKILAEEQPRDYRQWMYGTAERPGVTSVRPGHPGLLPSLDFDQQPVLHGSAGRVRWPVLEA
jgi:hypothetical protein